MDIEAPPPSTGRVRDVVLLFPLIGVVSQCEPAVGAAYRVPAVDPDDEESRDGRGWQRGGRFVVVVMVLPRSRPGLVRGRTGRSAAARRHCVVPGLARSAGMPSALPGTRLGPGGRLRGTSGTTGPRRRVPVHGPGRTVARPGALRCTGPAPGGRLHGRSGTIGPRLRSQAAARPGTDTTPRAGHLPAGQRPGWPRSPCRFRLNPPGESGDSICWESVRHGTSSEELPA